MPFKNTHTSIHQSVLLDCFLTSPHNRVEGATRYLEQRHFCGVQVFEPSRTNVLDVGSRGHRVTRRALLITSQTAPLAQRAPAQGCQFLPVKN